MQRKKIDYLSAISLNERIKYIKLLFRWQGSVWKLLWADFLWFILMYIGLTLFYRLYIVDYPFWKRTFETVVSYMNKVGALVPLSFLLGFFVSTILGRWWQVVLAIPWMTKASFAFQSLIYSKDPKVCRNIRSTLGRYLNLAWILCFYNLSLKVKDKFFIPKPQKKESNKWKISECCEKKKKAPMIDETDDVTQVQSSVMVRQRMEIINDYPVVKEYYGGKLINEDELEVFERFEQMSNSGRGYRPHYMVPMMWATKVLERSLQDGYIASNHHFIKLVEVMNDFRSGLGTMSVYSDFNVPLVYTQVVIIVVYSFLLSEIFSQQVVTRSPVPAPKIIKDNETIANSIPMFFEVYFPIYTIIKFLIYMGWFKIGLSLVNPLGGEQSDLPLDTVMDYNLEIAATVGRGDDKFYPDYLGPNNSVEKRREKFEFFAKKSAPDHSKCIISKKKSCKYTNVRESNYCHDDSVELNVLPIA